MSESRRPNLQTTICQFEICSIAKNYLADIVKLNFVLSSNIVDAITTVPDIVSIKPHRMFS